jgi:phage terminase Nu1 subunit (DNA packaging protein)
MTEGLNTERLLDLGPKATAKAYQDILKKIQGGEILTPAEVRSFELLEKKLRGKPEERPEASNDSIVDSLEKVAAHFKKSLRTVQRWAYRKGMPSLSGGRYDLIQIRRWLDEQQGVRGPGRPGEQELKQWNLPEESGKDFWDKEGKKYQALVRQLEYRTRLGELVERGEVEALFAARAMAFKTSMLGFARVLPPLLMTCANEREMEAVIDRLAREHLENICRPLPEKFGAQAASEDADRPNLQEVNDQL